MPTRCQDDERMNKNLIRLTRSILEFYLKMSGKLGLEIPLDAQKYLCT